MKRLLPFTLIILVGAAALGSGFALFRHQKAAVASAEARAAADLGPGKPGAKPPHIRGDVMAPVTLEEFGDFQCPPCGALSAMMAKLEQDYGTRLRVIFRQYPLEMHAHAAEAARIAEAAGMQDHFWEMHDLLYKNQTTWSQSKNVTADFEGYASKLGLDLSRFKKDVADKESKERIEADQARAESLGVDSTPTLFLNHKRVPQTSVNEPGLHTLIDAALGGKTSSSPAPSK